MKKSIIFVALSLIFSLSLCLGMGLLSPARLEVARAKCTTVTTEGKQEEKTGITDNRTPDEMGNIPFSLYTTRFYNPGSYDIVDYMPTFNKTINESSKTVLYEIEEDSVPYILLSSKKGEEGTTIERLYHTTLHFKFNDSDVAVSSSSISSLDGGMMPTITLRSSLKEELYRIVPTYNTEDLSNIGLMFSVNLLERDSQENVSPRIPKVYDDDNNPVELGQGEDNAVAYREGLYTFEISYIPKSASGIMGDYHCTFVISFYIVDYSSYMKDERPLTMHNADELNDTGYYLYNYNYDEAPVVQYDPSKFALNFSYAVPTSATTEKTYYMEYQSFNPSIAGYEINGGRKIGDVALYSPYFNDTYLVPVYDFELDNDSLDYTALFDLADFEKNFILKHASGFGTACFQGVYSFSLDMLIVSSTHDKMFSIVNSDTFGQDILDLLTGQNLVIYGYDLRYNDQETGNDVSLKNDKYGHNLIVRNDAIDVDENMYVNIPSSLITTNLAPLNFHSYGNLTGGNYSAYFILDNSSTDSQFLETYFKEIAEMDEDYENLQSLYAQRSEQNDRLEAKIAELDAEEDQEKKQTIQGDIDAINAELNSLQSEIYELEIKTEWSDRTGVVDELSNLIQDGRRSYTQSSAISGNGIWLLELKYRIGIVIDGINQFIYGTQYVAFRIDNTAQMITAHAVELDERGDLESLYTFNQYTKYPIRIALRHYDNSILAPVKVEYRYYAGYDRTVAPTSYATLTLNKDNNGESVKYSLVDDTSSVEYEYYVLRQGSQYTFSQNGTYVVTISSTKGSSVSSIIVNIESGGVSDTIRKVYNVDLNTSAKTDTEVTKQNGIYLTSKPFTLEWSTTNSKSDCYTYVGYMSLAGDNNSKSLFKDNDNYYLTNAYAFKDYMADIEKNYKNSYGETRIKNNQYFKKDGLYFFYVYDKAGNYFTETILLDSTLPATLQGKYVGEEENSLWVEDEIVDNNYVHEETLLYFGSHKALRLPITSETTNVINITNSSYLTKYDSSLNKVAGRDIVNLFGDEIDNDFYKYLISLASVERPNGEAIIGNASNEYYYYMLPNSRLEYEKIVNGEEVSSGILPSSSMGKVKLYPYANATQVFSGEAQYIFTLTGGNGIVSPTYYIEMNFDMISGTFYAYNDKTNIHAIQKDAGTNLNFLAFEYDKASANEDYYSLTELKYDYYAFDYKDYRGGVYPFSSTITESQDILKSAKDMGNGKMRVEAINVATLSSLTATKAGKYVITRTYKGGTHDKVVDTPLPSDIEIGGEYYRETPTRTGGSYVILGEGDERVAKALFDLDSLTRTYTVYVDRNNIISTTYLPDMPTPTREVGSEIKLTLGSGIEDYKFIDFFKTSVNLQSLTTNKIPVKVDIPYSKYFFRPDASSYVASKFSFARLNVTITFYPQDGSASKTYIVNNKVYNKTTGMCISQDLISATNVSGDLIFSQNGRYVITITDNTGYNDWAGSARNVGATTFTYTFNIEYAQPEGVPIAKTGNLGRTELNQTLDGQYATNINTSINNNEIFMQIVDHDDPYFFNVKTITVSNGTDSVTGVLEELNDGDNALSGELIKSIRKTLMAGSGELFDNVEYTRYEYEVYLNLDSEGTYEITLSYNLATDNPSYAFSYRTFIITIDRSKPTTNIFRLIEDETFLINGGYYNSADDVKASFIEENFDTAKMSVSPSIFSYAFPVNNAFALTYDENDTSSYFFLRNYNKYTGENISDRNSSITADMTTDVYEASKAYYYNENIFGGYTKFSEIGLVGNKVDLGSNTYYKVNYRQGVSLHDIILSTMGYVGGYYEIIERDDAGNYRCYTVYIAPSNTYKMLDVVGTDEDLVIRGINEKDISGKEFTLTSMSVATGWGEVIVNMTTVEGTRTYVPNIKFSPYKNYLTDSEISSLNTFFTSSHDRKITLNLLGYNSQVKDISRQINLSMGSTRLTFSTKSNGGDTYTIVLPPSQKTAVVYLTSFTLSYWQNGIFNKMMSHTLDSNPAFFENGLVTGLGKGIYLINYTDNVHSSIVYETFLHLGEYYIDDFDSEYQFQHENYLYDEQGSAYYSGGDIMVTYEANIYIVKVNGVTISGSDNETESVSLSNYNCKTFSLKSSYDLNKGATEKIGGESKFVVEYYAITKPTSLQKSITFVIFDSLPEINLTNGNESSSDKVGASIVDDYSQVTNTTVKIDWGKIECSFAQLSDGEGSDSDGSQISEATLYRKNNDTSKYEVFISKIERGRNDIISDEGHYMLQIRNRILGNSRNVYFSIQMGEIPLYSIMSSGRKLAPSSIETLSLASNKAYPYAQTQSDGLIIDCIYSEMLYRHNSLNEMSEIVERGHDEFMLLAKDLGYNDVNGAYTSSSTFNESAIGISNVTRVEHYYTTTNYDISYNSVLDLKVQQFVFHSDSSLKTTLIRDNVPSQVGEDYYTTIYLVYTLKGPIRIKFFAVTRVPSKTNLLNGVIGYKGGVIELSSSSASSLSKTLSNNNDVVKNGRTDISFNTFSSNVAWFNQGNYVYVSDQYGADDEFYTMDFTMKPTATGSSSTSTIIGSGTHKLMFKDLAGNTHQFSSSSFVDNQYVYTLSLLDQVIYYVEYNDKIYNPAVQYAVYNDSVNVVIDKAYLSKDFYTLGKISISVTKNGVPYVNYTMNDNVITFTETGKYVLSLDAKFESRSLNTATYNFTLLSSTASRLAYEFVEVDGYEITKVMKDGEDITSRFASSTGKVTALFISSTSSLSGNGRYDVTMRYGKKTADSMDFSFFINDYVPIIYCNVEHGGTTTGNIVLTFDQSTLYEQLGKCYINIKIYNNDSKSFLSYGTIEVNKDKNNNGTVTRTITQSNSYFIQIQTENGNIISSYRVNKTDPLNAFAIIAIVVVALAVIALVIIVIKLRTRMKIR